MNGFQPANFFFITMFTITYGSRKILIDSINSDVCRYTPLYALLLLIYITLSPYLGQGGPIYPIDGIESPSCRQYWWRNLLYINNFFNIRDGCMPVKCSLECFNFFEENIASFRWLGFWRLICNFIGYRRYFSWSLRGTNSERRHSFVRSSYFLGNGY